MEVVVAARKRRKKQKQKAGEDEWRRWNIGKNTYTYKKQV